jgi:glyoxylase-like metal-dependent hydrolase (beta-lactamase superfamily II)
MMGAMRANIERAGIPLKEISWGLATHYHLDHAGLAQDLKNVGMRLLVIDVQVAWIPRINDHVKPADNFTDISLHDNTVISCAESRHWLASMGIGGEILHTPGHSPDSVSLLLDTGDVFTGDLTHPMLITEEEADVTNASWSLLRENGATTVYAGHGPVRPMGA